MLVQAFGFLLALALLDRPLLAGILSAVALGLGTAMVYPALVAAVTGGLAGAYDGLDAVPARWTRPLHVPLPWFDGRVLLLADLLADRLGPDHGRR